MTDDVGEWKGTWVLQCWLDGQLTYWDGKGTTQTLSWAQHYPTKQEALMARQSMLQPGTWEAKIGHAVGVE